MNVDVECGCGRKDIEDTYVDVWTKTSNANKIASSRSVPSQVVERTKFSAEPFVTLRHQYMNHVSAFFEKRKKEKKKRIETVLLRS